MTLALALVAFLFLLLILLALIVLILWQSSLVFTGAPFIPIPHEVVPLIISALKLHQNSIVYDLGCGDGRVLFACAKSDPQIQCIGYDHALVPTWLSRIKLWRTKETRVKIERKNFFRADLSQATHVFTYLFPKLMNALLPKLQKELRPGTRLVSCDFIFDHMMPIEIIDLNRPARALGKKIYVYEF